MTNTARCSVSGVCRNSPRGQEHVLRASRVASSSVARITFEPPAAVETLVTDAQEFAVSRTNTLALRNPSSGQ